MTIRLLCSALLLTLPTTATATPLKVAVLPVQLDATAQGHVPETVLDETVLAAVQNNTHYDVIGRDDIASMLDYEKQKDLFGCDDTGCFAELGGDLSVGDVRLGAVCWTPLQMGFWTGDSISAIYSGGTRLGACIPLGASGSMELQINLRVEYAFYDDFGCFDGSDNCNDYADGFGGLYATPELSFRSQAGSIKWGFAVRAMIYTVGSNNRDYQPLMVVVSIPVGYIR